MTTLFIGTHKGVFIAASKDRAVWTFTGPFHRGLDVHHVVDASLDSPLLLAAVNNEWYGSGISISTDQGQTWSEVNQSIKFSENSELSLQKIWCIRQGPGHGGKVVYAGVAPAGLFASHDKGISWEEVTGLSNDPTRDQWNPGAGGMMVHSICPHPTNPDMLHIGISAAGVFVTEDGGQTWAPRNQGVLADFMPDNYPEVGQCVHHLTRAPGQPDRLYQQNHCGVYRSDDAGQTWIDISEGLPSRFGFPIQCHPRNPDVVFVVPEESPDVRCPVDGQLAVFRSRDAGSTWSAMTTGLPGPSAYMGVYREAFCCDLEDNYGLYMGTSTGEIYFSLDEGENWHQLAEHLPPVYGLSTGKI